MSRESFVAVKNRTKESQILCQDSDSINFEPGQIRILPARFGNHANTRVIVRHVLDKEGKPLPSLQGLKLFDLVPLDEALKSGAALEEDGQVVEARRRLKAKEEEEKAIAERIKSQMLKEGWKAPEHDKGGRK